MKINNLLNKHVMWIFILSIFYFVKNYILLFNIKKNVSTKKFCNNK